MHGSSGYTDSADYVYGVAQEAGLDVQRQGVALAVGFVTLVLAVASLFLRMISNDSLL
jgi:hypothetical protein